MVSLNKEGDYWDFKQTHHSSNSLEKAKLVHDIICLANNVRHKGDRYLVFGISNDFDAVGVENDKNRRRQSDIIDILRGAQFAGGIHPDVMLETIEINKKEIDVLTIKDTQDKPCYLEKHIKDKDKIILSAGTIYTRTLDANK